jgi:diguanylate cyclase (GGDEF)-like protein/PAS domain S-box-containing protein
METFASQNNLVALNKRLEEIVAQRTQEFQILYNSSPCGYHCTDLNGVIVLINDTELKWLGYTREEVVGKMNIKDFLTAESIENYKKHFPLFLLNGYIENLEFEIIGKNQVPRFISASAKRVNDENGNFIMSNTVLNDITDRKILENQFKHLANYDDLTELPNRRLLRDRLSQSLIATSRSGFFGALLFIDLDKFKVVNDTFGHHAGDYFLVEVARRIKACVREMDTVSRTGGDEFVVLFNQLTDSEEKSIEIAMRIADKVRQALLEPYQIILPIEKKDQSVIEYVCTASIGISIFSGSSKELEALLEEADTAMYKAKSLGGDQVIMSVVVI